MARKSKHEQLDAHLEAVKRLRQELAEQERKARRRRHDELASALTVMGLDEALLALSEADRQRIGALDTISDRLRAWAMESGQHGQPEEERQEGAEESLEASEPAERQAGIFGGR